MDEFCIIKRPGNTMQEEGDRKGNQLFAKEPKRDQSELDLIDNLHTKDGAILSDRLFEDRDNEGQRGGGQEDSRTCTSAGSLSARDTVSGPLERLTITCPPLPAARPSQGTAEYEHSQCGRARILYFSMRRSTSPCLGRVPRGPRINAAIIQQGTGGGPAEVTN
jgi:hypothetical protein